MTEAEKAFAAAEAAIARVAASDGTVLDLSDEEFHALEEVPESLSGLASLQGLTLENTQVGDLAPLAGLTSLQRLDLVGTRISDLAPLTGLANLQILYLNATQISDLAPLAGLANLQHLGLGNTRISDLAPLAGLANLQHLSFPNTWISDLAPLTGLANLQILILIKTQISDVGPLAGLANLQGLSLDNTRISDLAPLADLPELRKVYVSGTPVTDLRPLLSCPALATHEWRAVRFQDTEATRRDPELARLAEVDVRERTDQTLAYLRTLPAWPAPLAWEVTQAQETAPPPDPALPMVLKDGVIDLKAEALENADADDPLRASLFDELQERVEDLIRISANQDDGIYREACRLRDRLKDGLHAMEPARVHICIEALRRGLHRLPNGADKDLTHALDTILEIGPGLTVGTEEVGRLLDRIRENQLSRKDRAEVEAEARIAESIAQSILASDTLKSVAIAAADPDGDGQLASLRTPLARNWTAKTGVIAICLEGAAGNATWDALTWLALYADDIMIVARGWGEPVLAWIAPILQRAREMVAAGTYVSGKFRRKD